MAYWGFGHRRALGPVDRQRERGRAALAVFRRLYAMRFPIRHMQLSDEYGPVRAHPADGDVSASFECRQAVPSRAVSAGARRHWSEHAYGEAVDINPVEAPYVGCGMTRDKTALS
jgi:hypothetical protein